MGLLARLERRFTTFHPGDGAAAALFGGAVSNSGQLVTPESGFRNMAVYRAVRLLSQTLASLPLLVYEKLKDGSMREATEHPLTPLLTVAPNRWQTPFEFKEMLGGHLELRGNAYAEVFSDGRGRPRELVPLHPDRVMPIRGYVDPEGPELVWFQYTPLSGPMRVILADEMLHLRGFSFDGLVGISPVAAAREAIGLAQAAEEHAARFFSNNAEPGGVLSHPKSLDEDAKKRLKKSWEAAHAGSRQAHRVAVLEEGLTWTSIGMSNKDSQFLENRKFQVVEIARMFDLPPHKLMEMTQATFSNIEHQSMEFVTDAIRPRAVRWEQATERDCLLPSDAGRFVVRYTLEELTRGDSAARSTYNREMWGIGALSINDIRRRENLNPVAGGDERFIPLNMIPLSKAGDLPVPGDPAPSPSPSPSPTPAPDPAAQRAIVLRTRIAIVHRRLFVEAITRIVKREVSAARKALQDGVALADWIDGFYPEHEAFARRALEPAIDTAGDALAAAAAVETSGDPELYLPTTDGGRGLLELLRNLAGAAARAHVITSRAQLRQHLVDRGATDVVLATWEATRVDDAASRELAAVASAVVGYVYRTAGLAPPATLSLPILRS
jgi:HK97 family phage portal protein